MSLNALLLFTLEWHARNTSKRAFHRPPLQLTSAAGNGSSSSSSTAAAAAQQQQRQGHVQPELGSQSGAQLQHPLTHSTMPNE